MWGAHRGDEDVVVADVAIPVRVRGANVVHHALEKVEGALGPHRAHPRPLVHERRVQPRPGSKKVKGQGLGLGLRLGVGFGLVR